MKEMQNVLYFLDEASGAWLPMPLNWERHVPNITSIVEKVQVPMNIVLENIIVYFFREHAQTGKTPEQFLLFSDNATTV